MARVKVRKEVEIGSLFDELGIKDPGEYKAPSSLKVKTTDGFKKVEVLRKTQENPEWFIKTNNREGVFADFHRVEVNEKEDQIDNGRKWKFVRNLNKEDEVNTENGFEKIKEVYFNGKHSQMYDFQVEETRSYLTNGFNSHNSLVLCNFAINMFLQGYKVQLYTFEVSVKRILTRLISNLTNMSKQEIFLDEEGVKEKLQEMLDTGGDIRLKEYPANEANANMLLAHINDMSMYEDFEADAYLIDHLLIQATNDRRLNPEDSYTYYKKVTEETRNIAKKTDRPVIAPTQINREGMSDRGGSKAVVTGKNVASSRGIIDTVDCFWPIAQSAKDKEDGRMYLIGDKSRNDRSGWKIQYNVDYEHMKIAEGHIVN